MRLAHAGISDEPRHARSQTRRQRRYGGLVVVVLYVVVIGLSEWRLQRHVDSIRAGDEAPALIEPPPASDQEETVVD